jgi:hypothetical protein
MDLTIVKKKLEAYVLPNGIIKNPSNEILFEVLKCWEQWNGKIIDFAIGLKITKRQLDTILVKAKKLQREGKFEVYTLTPSEDSSLESNVTPIPFSMKFATPMDIELSIEGGRVVRFSKIELLIEFLKKAA